MTDETRAYDRAVLQLASISPALAQIVDDRMRETGMTFSEVEEQIRFAMGIVGPQREGGYNIPCVRLFTVEEIGWLLCGEFEGNHMASWVGKATPNAWTRPEGFDSVWYADESFIASPEFRFTVEHDDPNSGDDGDYSMTTVVDRASIVKGLSKMAVESPDHFADLISESSADAITYDVAFQYIVLGEVVYG